MMRSLYTASTGMYAQQLNVDTIAHNMSNVNTVGFKKQRVEFQDLLYQTIRRPAVSPDTIQPTGMQVGLGVKPIAINTLFSEGSLQPTENPLDVAINGQGFFKIQVPGYDEPLYTRDGSFKLDATGQLVTADGYLVLGLDALDEGAYDVNIDETGYVTYKLPDGTEGEAGQIELAKFVNPSGLQKLGQNLYQATVNSGEAVDWDPESDNTTSLKAGYLEMSNIQVVEEMVNLITAQRAYETNSKVIQSSDEMLQTANNLRR
jgi:flagellar basal-body rod protein FlgG